jgi:hypothetical protein
MAASIVRISSALHLPTCPILIYFFSSSFQALFGLKKLTQLPEPIRHDDTSALRFKLDSSVNRIEHPGLWVEPPSGWPEFKPRCGNDISHTVPGRHRMGTGYSPCSGYRAGFLSVSFSVLISAVLIGSIRGLRQFIYLNALSRLRHLKFPQYIILNLPAIK